VTGRRYGRVDPDLVHFLDAHLTEVIEAVAK
jgi:hypothetical protein